MLLFLEDLEIVYGLYVHSTIYTDLEFYKRVVAFVMAYSFTEPTKDMSRTSSESSTESLEHKAPPMMVPMADILNHVAKNNARLDFGVESLKMVATQPIAEVFILLIFEVVLVNDRLGCSSSNCQSASEIFFIVRTI